MSGLTANFVSDTPSMDASLPGELVFGMPGEAGGYYTIHVSQPDANTMRLTFSPSKSTMNPIDPVDIILPQGPKGDPGQAAEDLDTAIAEALAQAKESGEFDGASGYTPLRGTDYWTEADIAQIKAYVDDAILGGAW